MTNVENFGSGTNNKHTQQNTSFFNHLLFNRNGSPVDLPFSGSGARINSNVRVKVNTDASVVFHPLHCAHQHLLQ